MSQVMVLSFLSRREAEKTQSERADLFRVFFWGELSIGSFGGFFFSICD